MTAIDTRIPFALRAKPPQRSLCALGIIHVDDAAHAMEPALGRGACQGPGNAEVLRAIAAAVPPNRVAVHYERLQLQRARMVVRETEARCIIDWVLAEKHLDRAKATGKMDRP